MERSTAAQGRKDGESKGVCYLIRNDVSYAGSYSLVTDEAKPDRSSAPGDTSEHMFQVAKNLKAFKGSNFAPSWTSMARIKGRIYIGDITDQ